MKKLLIFALISLVIISCRKDDDERSESQIVGTWKLIDQKTISGKDGSVLHSNTIPASDCIRKSNYIYKNNGIFIGEYFRNSQTGECGNIAYQEEMNYIYNDSEKTIYYKIDGITHDIKNVYSLTKTEMQILVNDKMDENGDGTPDKILRIYIKK